VDDLSSSNQKYNLNLKVHQRKLNFTTSDQEKQKLTDVVANIPELDIAVE